MKFLYHHRTQAEDGQAVHIRALQAALRAEGHIVREVGLVSQGEGEAAGNRESARKRWAWVGRLPRWSRELAEYAYSGPASRRLVAAGLDDRPDALYERYAFGNLAGVIAARRLGLPLLLEVNSPMVLELGRTRGLSFPRLAGRVENWIFGRATRVLPVTEVLARMLIEAGAAPERVVVIPNGVDLEAYAEPGDGAARARARAELGLEPEDPSQPGVVLGFVGYYRDWHRLDLAVRALGEPALARARLVLVGDGPAGPELARLAHELGVAERVHFAGPRPHGSIPGLLAGFDLALLPAINPYASPLKLHEYMAAGLATIAPDQPNLREVLSPGVDAELFPPGDGEAFGRTLLALGADPERRARLGAAARRTVQERDLTWRGNARRVAALAAEAIAESNSGEVRP